MGVLEEHQGRIAALREGLTRLLQLHKHLHDLHAEGLAVARSGDPNQAEQVRALQEQARVLHREIAILRGTLDPKGEASPD